MAKIMEMTKEEQNQVALYLFNSVKQIQVMLMIDFEAFDIKVTLKYDSYVKLAKRPKNSMLSKDKLIQTGIEVASWEDALKRYLKVEL